MGEGTSKEVKKIPMKTLITHMKNTESMPDKRFCFILGAGASKQSGIPTGKDLAEKWLNELEDLYDSAELDHWKRSKKITKENVEENYSVIYEKRFEIDPSEGYYYIQNTMKGINPSFGYSVLVQVLTKTSNNVVITTNFDSLVEDAMFIYTNEKPLVCGHESLTGFIKPIMSRPLVAKIHRDLFFSPKSTEKDTDTLDKSWDNALTNIFKFYTPIIIGYGGNDGSLMDFLNDMSKINGTLFWCYKAPDEPNEKIKQIVLKHNGYLVPIDGFDEFFVHVNEKYRYELLGEKIVSVANTRAETYRNQFDKLIASENTDNTDKALKNIVKEQPRTWWTIQIEINSIKNDIKRQENLYKNGIKEFPASCELMGNYAIFLKDIKKDYDEAEKYYVKAIGLDSNNANNLGNYANFLTDIKKDYDKAEKYYVKSIELDPNHANNLGNYASFLKNIKKDYDKAEKYYAKSIELDPNNANNLGNYAVFLEIIKKDYDKTEKHYVKAIESDPNNAINVGNYASFLKDIKKDYVKAEKYYVKSIELDPNNAINVGNYASFLEIIKKDYIKAEKYYVKAIELDPNDAINVGNYASFLETIKKDYDEAEKYYVKAIELDPNNANNLGSYASFLGAIKKDYDKAKKYEDILKNINKNL